jgi:L-galactose dehydrogenase
MDRTKLGRTGLDVSVLGLGCGGYSRLGTSTGAGDDNAIAIVRRATDLGINLFDTAEMYATETHVGKAIAGLPRDKVVLCTKTLAGSAEDPRDPRDLRRSVEQSLVNLGTDVIDVYLFHAVHAALYPHVVSNLLPEVLKFRDQGKIRFVGITEGFEFDPSHHLHQLSSRDTCWDIFLVGFNMLNTSARRTVFPHSRAHGTGILGMFAVRHAFVCQENLKPILRNLVEQGVVPAQEIDLDDPLGFVLDEAESLTEAAYRYCRHDPDVDAVLCGTGSIAHLEENVRSASKPPLSAECTTRLDRIFGAVDCETGKVPGKPW